MAVTDATATDAARAIAAAKEWDAAWMAGDLDRMLALYADDAVWEDTQTLLRPLRGKHELRRLFTSLLQAYSVMTVQQEQLFAPVEDGDPNVFATAWRLQATFTGPYGVPGLTTQTLQPTGDRVDLHGMVKITFRDGLIARVEQYSRMVDLQRQIGLLPTPGTPQARMMTRLQALAAKRRRKRNG